MKVSLSFEDISYMLPLASEFSPFCRFFNWMINPIKPAMATRVVIMLIISVVLILLKFTSFDT